MLPKHRPPTHPGEMLLKTFLEPAGVSQADAAKRIGVPFQRLTAIVRGRRAVSADTAIRLEALTAHERRILASPPSRLGFVARSPRASGANACEANLGDGVRRQ